MATKNYKNLTLESKYAPKKSEKYMSLEQKAYFYQILMAQKEEIEQESNQVLNSVRMAEKLDAAGVGDDSDSSNYEQEVAMNLKMSERKNNLLRKINQALTGLENGSFGYSLVSGDEIGISRMIARPFATVTIEEQEELENKES